MWREREKKLLLIQSSHIHNRERVASKSNEFYCYSHEQHEKKRRKKKINKQQTRYRWWWWNCAWFFMFITLEPEQIITVFFFYSRVYCVLVCILWRTQNEKYKHTLLLLIRTNKSINTERLRIGCVCFFFALLLRTYSLTHTLQVFSVYSPVLIAHCAQTHYICFCRA